MVCATSAISSWIMRVSAYCSNKWDDRIGLDSRELIHRLGLPEFARIPFGTDLKVDISLNQSKPLVLDPPNEVSNAIVGAVNGLYRPLETLWSGRKGKVEKEVQIALVRKVAIYIGDVDWVRRMTSDNNRLKYQCDRRYRVIVE